MLALLAFTTISGCGAQSAPDAETPADMQSRAQEKPANLFEPPKVSDSDLQELVQGNNEFAFDLYARLAKQEGNIFFSPYSISTALAMTYAGARGETAEQMAKVLRFNLPPERLHAACGKLIADLQSNESARPYQLFVANALWAQQGFPFLDSFLRITRGHYRARFQELDFGQPEQATQTINRWVEEQTNHRIKKLLGPNDLNTGTQLVLTNAIYFKASWITPFLKHETKDATFEVTPDEKVAVKMMRTSKAQFMYYATDECEWLQLPYIGHQVSMLVVLPRKGRLADVEKSLSPSVINKAVKKHGRYIGEVALPRFKVSMATQLTNELTDMGMGIAFAGNADFSGMTGSRDLKINQVIHQAYLSVDEAGTEAAAATAVEMYSSISPPFSFTADRPFLLLIRDDQTGSILFSGRVVQPAQ